MNAARNVHEIVQLNKALFEANYHYWQEHVLFSFNWWFLLTLTILPWVIWWGIVDKARMLEFMLMGTMTMVVAVNFDMLGHAFLFWTYNYKLIQTMPSLSAIDLSLLPVLYMVIYQFFSKWKTYVIAHVILSLGGSFILEPLFVWMGIYTLHGWRYIYSFPIYIMMGITFKWLIIKLKSLEIAYDIDK